MKYHPEAFPMTCSCGTVYDQKAWVRLPYSGIQGGVLNGARFFDDLEMRHCACRSTMSVKIVTASPLSWYFWWNRVNDATAVMKA